MKVYFFASGQVAAFDENGEQVGELQRYSLATYFAERAASLGYDPTTFEIEDGNRNKIQIIDQHKDGEKDCPRWNWRML